MEMLQLQNRLTSSSKLWKETFMNKDNEILNKQYGIRETEEQSTA